MLSSGVFLPFLSVVTSRVSVKVCLLPLGDCPQVDMVSPMTLTLLCAPSLYRLFTVLVGESLGVYFFVTTVNVPVVLSTSVFPQSIAYAQTL